MTLLGIAAHQRLISWFLLMPCWWPAPDTEPAWRWSSSTSHFKRNAGPGFPGFPVANKATKIEEHMGKPRGNLIQMSKSYGRNDKKWNIIELSLEILEPLFGIFFGGQLYRQNVEQQFGYNIQPLWLILFIFKGFNFPRDFVGNEKSRCFEHLLCKPRCMMKAALWRSFGPWVMEHLDLESIEATSFRLWTSLGQAGLG